MNIEAKGTFHKKGYCNKCWSIVTWAKDDERSDFGHQIVLCPVCGSPLHASEAIIVEDNNDVQPQPEEG